MDDKKALDHACDGSDKHEWNFSHEFAAQYKESGNAFFKREDVAEAVKSVLDMSATPVDELYKLGNKFRVKNGPHSFATGTLIDGIEVAVDDNQTLPAAARGYVNIDEYIRIRYNNLKGQMIRVWMKKTDLDPLHITVSPSTPNQKHKCHCPADNFRVFPVIGCVCGGE